MNNRLDISLAVNLCSADMSSGFISLDPVLGNRDELISQRISWYYERLTTFVKALSDTEYSNISLLKEAVELTCADICCDAITIAPVLYDRDEKIFERLQIYFNMLQDIGSLPEIIAAPVEISETYKNVNNAVSRRIRKKKKR